MRQIDADALYDDMLYEMCGTGYQTLALSVIGRAPTIEINMPNDPLTLKELLEMDGEPVWVVGVSCINHFKGHWDICEWENGEVVNFPHCMESPDIMLYGKTWLAYRDKPE